MSQLKEDEDEEVEKYDRQKRPIEKEIKKKEGSKEGKIETTKDELKKPKWYQPSLQ